MEKMLPTKVKLLRFIYKHGESGASIESLLEMFSHEKLDNDLNHLIQNNFIFRQYTEADWSKGDSHFEGYALVSGSQMYQYS